MKHGQKNIKFSNNCTADSHMRWYLTSEPWWQSRCLET